MMALIWLGAWALGVIAGILLHWYIERTRGEDERRALDLAMPYAYHLAEQALKKDDKYPLEPRRQKNVESKDNEFKRS